MSFAGNAARAATVQLPMGQIALVGFGAFCLTNPDKFFELMTAGAKVFYAVASSPNNNNQHPQQPIVIHHTSPAPVTTNSRSSVRYYLFNLVLWSGFCWGSYMVMVTVLPDAAKALLPVNRSVFNRAVTSLGRAVLNLKDTLMVQIRALGRKQDELSNKQDATHTEVLTVKANVQDVKGDLVLLQQALDLCHASLSESERRTSYISRGVQLLTRGVSTILPEDENLLHEIVQFNIAGDQFNGPTPLQRQRMETALRAMRQGEAVEGANQSTSKEGSHSGSIEGANNNHNDDPENDLPPLPEADAAVDAGVSHLHALLKTTAYQ